MLGIIWKVINKWRAVARKPQNKEIAERRTWKPQKRELFPYDVQGLSTTLYGFCTNFQWCSWDVQWFSSDVQSFSLDLQRFWQDFQWLFLYKIEIRSMRTWVVFKALISLFGGPVVAIHQLEANCFLNWMCFRYFAFWSTNYPRILIAPLPICTFAFWRPYWEASGSNFNSCLILFW